MRVLNYWSTRTRWESGHGTQYDQISVARQRLQYSDIVKADVYSHGRSEEIIGKALTKYSIPRERVVILTKCFFGVDESGAQPQMGAVSANAGENINQVGLSRKHIIDAVDRSVRRLGTYIDVLQIHRLDRETPKTEIMRALNDVVESGKVRYIGASSMAAWEFQMLQNIADKHGWHRFISMQSHYNLLYREEEREMFPYCNETGVGLIPWSPLARGALCRPWGKFRGPNPRVWDVANLSPQVKETPSERIQMHISRQ